MSPSADEKKGIIFSYRDFKGDSDGMIKSEVIYVRAGKRGKGVKFRALLRSREPYAH